MKFYLHVLLLATGLSFFEYSSASNPNIVNFERTEYNASNSNWSVSEDSLGVMYFGNDNGLLEFDGIQWALNKQQGAEVVRAVYASGATVYTGGYEEFGEWNRDVSGILQYTSLSDSLPKGTMHNDDIWKIIKVGQSIYFQSFGGIYVYRQGKVKKLPLERNFLYLIKVRDQLWVQEIKGSLYKIVDDQLQKIPESDFLADTEVRVVLPYKEKECLIATSSKGMYIYDGKHFVALDVDKQLINSDINCGIRTQKGEYYLGTILDGIFQLDENMHIQNHFDAESSMQNNTVLDLFEDKGRQRLVGFGAGYHLCAALQRPSMFYRPQWENGGGICSYSIQQQTICGYQSRLILYLRQGFERYTFYL